MKASSSVYFVIFLCVVALAGMVAALLIPVGFLKSMNLPLLFGESAVVPSVAWRVLAFTSIVLVAAAACLFWWSLVQLAIDHDERVKKDRDDRARSPALLEPQPLDPAQCATDYFSLLGFIEKTKFTGYDRSSLILMSRRSRSGATPSTEDGVIVYPDGSHTAFSVGVLFGENSWQQESAEKIHRQRSGRPVKIETALNSAILKELADRNDYIITVGLSSNSGEDDDPEFNTKLSHARAFNLAVAVMKSGWKEPDRIWPFALGYATKAAASNTLEPLQRPAVLIGVVANRNVVVPDVTVASFELISLEGARLGEYSFSIREPRSSGRIDSRSRYIDPSSLQLTPKAYEVPVLPSVQGQVAETGCDG